MDNNLDTRVTRLETSHEHIIRDVAGIKDDMQNMRGEFTAATTELTKATTELTKVTAQLTTQFTNMSGQFETFHREVREDFRSVNERLDTFRNKVDEEFKSVRSEVKEEVKSVRGEVEKMNDRVGSVEKNVTMLTERSSHSPSKTYIATVVTAALVLVTALFSFQEHLQRFFTLRTPSTTQTSHPPAP